MTLIKISTIYHSKGIGTTSTNLMATAHYLPLKEEKLAYNKKFLKLTQIAEEKRQSKGYMQRR
jgi:hypothetical protein